jgi:ADP-heptose:LPS heptosyltransferase
MNDANRSLPLESFLEMLKGFELVCLQKDVTSKEAALLEQAGVARPVFEDFYDTALVTRNCKCVVSVDTSIAHLTASVRTPLFLLQPFNADWRWGPLTENGGACQWYSEAAGSNFGSPRMYRPAKMDEWAPVLDQVRQDLTKFMGVS